MCVSDCMVFKIRVGRQGFFFKPTSMLLPLKSHKLLSFFLTTAYKHRSNVQGNEENSNRKPVFNKSVSIKRLSESVNIATVKHLLLKSETNTETETNFPILPIYYFFWHKKDQGRSETHIFFFWPNIFLFQHQESESTIGFKNRSLDRMPTSD